MTVEQILLLILLLLVFLSFFFEWLPTEITALSASGILLVAGILTIPDFTLGFGNKAVITIGSMFVISAALEYTGVIDGLVHRFRKLAKTSEKRALLLIITIPPILSAFVNNTPIVVILMPVLISFARDASLKASRLLMPLSYATIIGGTCTMVGTSTNLLVEGVARSHGLESFNLFTIAPLGLCALLVGGLYLYFVAPHLLPSRETVTSLLGPERMREYLIQVEVTEGSPLLGHPLLELLKKELKGIQLVEIRRQGQNLLTPLPDVSLSPGDRLLLRAGRSAIRRLRETTGTQVGWDEQLGLRQMEQREALIVEGIIGPNSSLISSSMRELDFRQRFGLLVLAIHRQGTNITQKLSTLRLQFGDILLVEGTREAIGKITAERDFISLSTPEEKPKRTKKAWITLTALGGFIAAGAMGFDTMLLAFLAALVVVITGCVRPQEAFSAVDWRILFLIIGMLGLGRALENTGTAALLAQQLTNQLSGYEPWVLLAALYLMTNITTEVVSNNAVAVLFTPIAINMANAINASPIPFIITIMMASSASFATPIGYQTNTYVYGAGGYKFTDFLRVGLPLSLLLWALCSTLIPIFWPI